MALRTLQAKVHEASNMFFKGAYRDAIMLLQTVAERAHDVPNGQTIECESLRMVGHGLIRLRNFEPAARCLDTCLTLACTLKNPRLEADAHVALGQLAAAKDPPDLPAAQAHHEHARDLSKKSGDVAGEAAACLNLANTRIKRGYKTEGLEAMHQALELRRRQRKEAKAALAAAEAELGCFETSTRTRRERSRKR